MNQSHDSIHEALIEAVKALGGTKSVAKDLWPSAALRDLDDARRRLANCLNTERPEKLSLDELMHILIAARKAGHHGVMVWLCAVLGYQSPVPKAPADERDELQRQFLKAAAEMRDLADRIAAL